MNATIVTNKNYAMLDYHAAAMLMDDDIREELHWRNDLTSYQAFFTAYEKAHEAKYGAEWELSKANPVW